MTRETLRRCIEKSGMQEAFDNWAAENWDQASSLVARIDDAGADVPDTGDLNS